MRLHIASPKPIPCALVVKRGAKSLGNISSFIPTPVVSEGYFDSILVSLTVYGDIAAFGHSFNCVFNEVDEYSFYFV